MKKILGVVIGLILIGQVSFAQSWIDVAVKGAFVPGMLFNQSVLEDDDYIFSFSSGMFVGGKLGYYFNSEHSLAFEVISQKFTQKAEVMQTAGWLSISDLQLPFLYKHWSESGGYTEVGPMLSFTNKINSSAGIIPKDMYNKQNWGFVFGFGQYLAGGDKIGLTMGFRLSYMLTDLVASNYQDSNGSFIYTPISENAMDNFKYHGTNPLYVGFNICMNWDFGYLVSSSCGKSTKFILFK